jgi:hypothetical protein
MQTNSNSDAQKMSFKEVFILLDNQYKYYYTLNQKRFSFFLVLNFVLLLLFLLCKHTSYISSEIGVAFIVTGLVMSVLWFLFMRMGNNLFIKVRNEFSLESEKMTEEVKAIFKREIYWEMPFLYAKRQVMMHFYISIIWVLFWSGTGFARIVASGGLDTEKVIPVLLVVTLLILISTVIVKDSMKQTSQIETEEDPGDLKPE